MSNLEVAMVGLITGLALAASVHATCLKVASDEEFVQRQELLALHQFEIDRPLK